MLAETSSRVSLLARPLVLLAGRAPDAGTAALAGALRQVLSGGALDAAGPFGALALRRHVARMAPSGEIEAVHVLDPRLAPAVAALRRRFGIAATATVGAGGLKCAGASVRRALAELDTVFVSDTAVAAALDECALMVTPPVVAELPAPRHGRSSLKRALDGLPPGRVVLGMPWPRERGVLRWYRDAVMPLLHGAPVTLLLGAPGRREAWLLLGTANARYGFRLHSGRLDAAAVAAAARWVDAFLLPAAPRAADDGLASMMVAAGVPVIADAGMAQPIIEHERSGIVVDRADGMALVSAINCLLALPAIQRHYLGEEFAAHARRRWSASAAAELHADRLAALVGRPRIPEALRAA